MERGGIYVDASAVGREFHRVAEQIGDYLDHRLAVKHYVRVAHTEIEVEGDAFVLRQRAERQQNVVHKRLEIAGREVDGHIVGLHLSEVHQLVDERQQMFGIMIHKIQLLNHFGVGAEFQGAFYRTDNQRERRTKFVRDVGEEGEFVQGEFLDFGGHLFQLHLLARNLLVLIEKQFVLAREFLSLGFEGGGAAVDFFLQLRFLIPQHLHPAMHNVARNCNYYQNQYQHKPPLLVKIALDVDVDFGGVGIFTRT